MKFNQDLINENDKKELEDRYISLAKGACADESHVVGDEVIIKSKGKQVGKLKLKDVCSSFRQRIDNTYEYLISKMEMENIDLTNDDYYDVIVKHINEEKIGRFMYNYISFVATCQKADTKLKSNNPEYLKLKKNITKKIQELHSKMSKRNIHGILGYAVYNLSHKESSKRCMESMFNEDTTFSIDDTYNLIKEIIPRKEFLEDKELRTDVIIAWPTELIKKLEKIGYIQEDKHETFSPRLIDEYGKDLNYEGKYLSTQSCVTAYLYGLMDLEHLKKNFSFAGVFNIAYLESNKNLDFNSEGAKYVPFLRNDDGKYTYKQHADIIMQILKDVKPKEKYSQGFWNYYMNGILSREQIDQCAEEQWMYIPDICDEYIKNRRMKANNETVEPKKTEFYEDVDYLFDDDEKVFEFFTPDVVVGTLMAYKDNKAVNKFIKQYLVEMYNQKGLNFSEEIYSALLKRMNELGYSTDECIKNIIDMYTDNYIGIDQIKNNELSQEELEELKKQGIENRLLVVDLYNNNLVSQDEVFEKYEEDEVFKMINNGMNPNILVGFYSTKEIVNFILTNKINSSSDLSSLRQGINIEDIKRMYQAERSQDYGKTQVINGLSYDDLNMLVTCGIITKEEADEIDQAYDYNSKIEKLIEQGLIVGDKNGIKVARNEGDGYSVSGNGYGPGKIGELDKLKLLSALDEDAIELELNSDVLKNYSLIIMPNDKIAIMEPTEDGQGASYVMSIKLALEQISNSENLDKEEIVDPLKEYSNRTGIRSIPGMETVNHRENWGYNLKKKMEEIHPNMNELIYSKDDGEQEKNARRAKIEKMQKEIQTKYLQQREKARNVTNVEFE